MKKLFLIIISIIFVGCNTNKTISIHYKPFESSRAYSMDIPKNYYLSLQIGNSYSYLFSYKNGAYIYISNELPMAYNSSNSPIINNLFDIDSIINHIVNSEYGSIPFSDTIIYSGLDKSFFWKWVYIYNKYPKYIIRESKIDKSGNEEIIYLVNPNPYDFLFVAYSHVSEKDKELFDKCIASLKFIEDTSLIRDPIITRFLKNENSKSK